VAEVTVLATALPGRLPADARPVATDLNQPMLDRGAARQVAASSRRA
jgi:hypothetical protein